MAFDPTCLDGAVEFGKLGDGEVVASICGFSLKIPDIFPPISINLPSLEDLLPKLPFPKLSFALSCDPNNPIDITAGLEFGGGRLPCQLPDQDNEVA